MAQSVDWIRKQYPDFPYKDRPEGVGHCNVEVHSVKWARWLATEFRRLGMTWTVYMDSGKPFNAELCIGPDAVEQMAAQVETEMAIDKIVGEA